MKKQISIGTVLAYINIGLNMVVSLFLTPFLLKCLGNSEYGVYRIISSFSGQLGIMSFGVSTLITRYVVLYNTKNQKKEKENFLFMAYVITLVLVLLVTLVGIAMYFAIDPLYHNSLSSNELLIAKRLFIILVLNVALSIVFDSMIGIIRAHEKFIVSYGISTIKLVLRIALIVFLLEMGFKSVAVVMVDAALSFALCIFSIIYSSAVLQEKPHFYQWDVALLKSCLFFSLAVFIQAIINQVNRNLDNVLLGALEGTEAVTIYSLGLTLYNIFISVITIFSGMYGPSATKLIANDANGDELTEFIIKPAKFEAFIAFLIISGFTLVGNEFIKLWLGTGYEKVYSITLILIIPAALTVIESISNNILDAKLKRMPLSIILVCMCVVNILLSIVFVNMVGFVGAAYGTAISTIVGNGLLMNLYLKKSLKINVFHMLKGIFLRPILVGLVTVFIGYFITLLPSSVLWLMIKIALITCVYCAVCYLIGLDKTEKSKILWGVKRIIRKE